MAEDESDLSKDLDDALEESYRSVLEEERERGAKAAAGMFKDQGRGLSKEGRRRTADSVLLKS